MKTLLFVGAGSFIGGVMRYLLATLIFNKMVSAFPYGTLAVNLIGCFFIGIVFGLVEKTSVNPDLRIFLMTGILGGFTTFSAFTNESVGLLREGNYGYAGVYIISSLVLGILLTFLGIVVARYV
jgi:CrcB protein